MKLAIFTNDSALFHLIQSCLAAEGAVCTRYGEDVELARALHREEFSAIVFDAASGMDASHPVLARRACYGDRRAPLIAVGDFCAREHVQAALNAGADDIVLMPVDPRELRLRFQLAVRRFACDSGSCGTAQTTGDELEMGSYRMSRRDGSVEIDGKPVRLTAREFAIAWVLFSQQGNYVTRRAIAATVWGSSEDIVGRTLEQHIYKLRKKLQLDGACGIVLRTMYAHGYRIEQIVERAVEPALARAAERVPETTLARATERALERTAEVAAPRPPLRPASGAANGACTTGGTIKLHTSGSEAARHAQPWSPESSDSWAFVANRAGVRRLA
ncbi:response regulator transcription factor [Paraburkholderia sp. D15]|uniref:response regulator transcription factor n=1 Tax=Paraburkholderia sp. D15 TaxID=2880218 RepID=UPI0024797902|nr:response regulator transcription factor [Paraburkholderia sp. D15]WGS54175.1 response regulator transcription factor [Paraburkholderia sp. D15]WKF60284.1 Sensory transduction protein regX3 [Paraburkholderia busanensis]